jgi:alginate O-acetyltransferase complex protein AlgI
MLFNSLAFVVFLPCVLIMVGVLPARWRIAFLLAASYFFYGCWNWRFLGLLLLTSVTDYWVGKAIHGTRDERHRRHLLYLSMGVNLSILGFFKYFNFFIDSVGGGLDFLGLHVSLPVLRIVLPVGISFYTFQSMGYTIDIYRRQMEPAKRFLDFASYVSYFPQLVAGPIERATHLLPQLLTPGRVTAERVNTALILMLIGFTKKVLIADSIAPEVDRIFAHHAELSSGELLRGAYLFALQIYCDFGGYSDIARGVSELFGIRLMINFNQPYLSQSLTEFWRRWHISLSSWLRDYLYFSLGGTRDGSWNIYRNLMVTMLIAGLWHGANWTYVVWGGLNGLVLAIELGLGVGRGAARATAWPARVARTLLTFHIWVLLMIVFRSPNFSVVIGYLGGLFRCKQLGDVGWLPFAAAAAVLAIDIPQYVSGDHVVFSRMPWWVQSPAYAAICFGILLFGGAGMPFIYFQF